MWTRALRIVTGFLVLAGLVVSFVWGHEERLVGEDVGLLKLSLVITAVGYLGYAQIQETWEAGRFRKRDGWAAFFGIVVFAIGLGIALAVSTEKTAFDAPRRFTNLFDMLVFCGLCAFGDAIFSQRRYQRSRAGELFEAPESARHELA